MRIPGSGRRKHSQPAQKLPRCPTFGREPEQRQDPVRQPGRVQKRRKKTERGKTLSDVDSLPLVAGQGGQAVVQRAAADLQGQHVASQCLQREHPLATGDEPVRTRILPVSPGHEHRGQLPQCGQRGQQGGIRPGRTKQPGAVQGYGRGRQQ